MRVSFSIPMPYNGGEWRISRRVVGPRGGLHWETVISQPATGGVYCADLKIGETYKQTYWTNGFATATLFAITENGIEWEDWED